MLKVVLFFSLSLRCSLSLLVCETKTALILNTLFFFFVCVRVRGERTLVHYYKEQKLDRKRETKKREF